MTNYFYRKKIIYTPHIIMKKTILAAASIALMATAGACTKGNAAIDSERIAESDTAAQAAQIEEDSIIEGAESVIIANQEKDTVL